MTTPTTPESPDIHAWEAFAERHAGNPFLGLDPLYALSEPIIDAIGRESPGFFDAGQERFERDLARTAHFGFFLRRAYGPGSDGTAEGRDEEAAFRERHGQTSLAIREMLTDELRRSGAGDEDVEDHFRREDRRREETAGRRAAYVGWLGTNPKFREELDRLRHEWEPQVRIGGRFPTLPLWYFPDATEGGELPPDCREACYDFYRRWGLEALLTWDWPVPMQPDLVGGLREDVSRFTEAGMVLVVPWYLLRGETLDLQEVVHLSRQASAPDHLLGWVNKRAERKGDDMGDARYRTLGWLYRYLELALRSRYGGACRGRQQRLDRALASVIGREEDTVKKLRLRLRRAPGATPDRPAD